LDVSNSAESARTVYDRKSMIFFSESAGRLTTLVYGVSHGSIIHILVQYIRKIVKRRGEGRGGSIGK
jgi:hypothetical protein